MLPKTTVQPAERWVTLLTIIFVLGPHTSAADEIDACISEIVRSAPAATTVGEIRAACADRLALTPESPHRGDDEAVSASAIKRRFVTEFDTMDRPYTLTAHRPNYVLPYTYNTRANNEPFEFLNSGQVVLNEEAIFQVSFKLPLAHDLLVSNSTLFFAYINQSWWQVYNKDFSSAFRESDNEPELFIRHYGSPTAARLSIAAWDLGVTHQSNGRPEPLSRSWNRLFANVAFDAGNLAVAVKAWYRLPEDASQDDNPDIYRFLGYGEVRALYTPNRNTFGLMLRPGTDKGAVEFTWSYPLSAYLRVYASYFNGYGESLLDYDHRVVRFAIGVALNDYLQK